MTGEAAAQQAARVICAGLDRPQYAQLSEIVLRQCGADCINLRKGAPPDPADRDRVPTVFVFGCFGVAGGRFDARSADPSQAPSLAVLPRGSPAASQIYLLGYVDHLGFPFVAEEVKARVLAAFFLLENRAAQPRYATDPLVEETCRFLIGNLTYNDGLDALARRMGTNRTHLSQRFRRALSDSPMAWLRKQRLLRARAMIEGTDRSIVDIALSVGYEDGNNFSTAFRKTFARSPRDHRNLCARQRN